jgi:hypothetical protein
MAKLYTFAWWDGEEHMVSVGWIVHLVGRWYLQWRLGRLSIERKPK